MWLNKYSEDFPNKGLFEKIIHFLEEEGETKIAVLAFYHNTCFNKNMYFWHNWVKISYNFGYKQEYT